MQILLNIENENVLEKLLWVLEHFKSDGVEIIHHKDTADTKSEAYQKLEMLDRDIEKNELIQSILFGMPKDYKYTASDKSDKEIWYEEAGRKYE